MGNKRILFLFLCIVLCSVFTAFDAAAGTDQDFTDIKNHWAKDAINEMTKAGIMNGVGNNLFDPNGSITREQFIKMIINAKKIELITDSPNTFADLRNDRWSYYYIETACKEGIIKVEDVYSRRFEPGIPITRDIASLWVARALKLTGENLVLNFKDSDSIKHKREVALVVNAGILGGSQDNSFRGESSATRAEAAVIIKRALKYISDNSLTVQKVTNEESKASKNGNIEYQYKIVKFEKPAKVESMVWNNKCENTKLPFVVNSDGEACSITFAKGVRSGKTEIAVSVGKDFDFVPVNPDSQWFNCVDSNGVLMNNYYLQGCVYDLDGDGTKELLIAAGDGLINSYLKVLKYVESSEGSYFSFVGEVIGQEYIYIESQGKIMVPYGSQGLFTEYSYDGREIKEIPFTIYH